MSKNKIKIKQNLVIEIHISLTSLWFLTNGSFFFSLILNRTTRKCEQRQQHRLEDCEVTKYNMSGKRTVSISIANAKRRKSEDNLTYFQRTLRECGLDVKNPPEKCEATQDIVYVIRDLRKILKQHNDYPRNVEKLVSEFERACNDKKTFEHYLFLNIVRKSSETTYYNVDFSVIKILLNVTFLQTKLIRYIFDKVFDVLNQPEFVLWVKMILKCFSNLDTIECSELLSTKLIDLLDISTDKLVRLEIISAIPDIIGDKEHDNVASEMSRIMCNESDNRYLIPAILDCLTYLCLSDSQFERLQKETLNLVRPSNAAYFSIFVKFLLTPGRLTDSAYEETIKDLRRELGWTSIIGSENDIATSQVLTAREIRTSMLSSKAVVKAWIKVISSCTSHTEHKPIDIIFLLIIASLSDEKQKQVENVMRKLIKLRILKEDILDKAFKEFKTILKENIMTLMSLANSLLKPGTEPPVEAFGSHMHMVMFSELTECQPIIVSELLQLVLNCKKSAINTLNILNDIASENMPLMKKQSSQMLILLDRLDDRTLTEVRAIMNLVCGLAYSFQDSDIRDELHIIIRKELGSSNPSIKIQGILAGIHAVKYLMKTSTNENVEVPDDITFNMTSLLPEGDLREAAQIIKLIHHSTAQIPDMITFFYDELYKIIYRAKFIEKNFLIWLANVVLTHWHENFVVDNIEKDTFGEIKISMQLRLNHDSEVEEDWGVNVAGIILEDNKKIKIEVLSPLFQLVRVLVYKKNDGDLSDINALLGCPIVMPIVDVDSMTDLSDSSVKKVLDCYVICVNWIRELLNAFVSQEDPDLKPKIINRIVLLKKLEKAIDKIRDKGKKPDHDDTAVAGSTKSQKTQRTQIANTKLSANHKKHFRPLDLTLIHLIQYNLTLLNTSETDLTFEILTYLLSHINGNLEKTLVPRIKKNTFLTKDCMEIYSYSEAETQAIAVSKIVPKLMNHVNLIISFLDSRVNEDGTIDLDSLNTLNTMESIWCLEHIYNLLTIYFGWIEFRNRNVPLLKSSLQIVAKLNDDKLLLEDLVTAVAKGFQKHEKYIIMISSAASLMQFMKTLQGLSTGPAVPAILKNMAHKFLSKQWKTLNDELEKGLFYNQCLDTLTKVYLENNEMEDLKNIITSLVDDIGKLRVKSSILSTLKSINKSNFSILFKNMGAVLCDKIKSYLTGGFTNEEHVEMWATVANILKIMSVIVERLRNKHTASHFLKKIIPILNLFLSKGFPILKIEFKDHRQSILDVLKDVETSTECLRNICSQSSVSVLMQKIPAMQEFLTSFLYKTKDLLQANDCLEALEMFNVKDVPEPRRKSKKGVQKTVHADVTVEDLDDDLPADDSDESSDVFNIDSVGISDMI